jgi:hypothetical protein
MPEKKEPVLLELAHLPREQTGPFLVLGLNKDASKEELEARWAERVKWARKQQFTVPLEDINWAREVVGDPAKRLPADVNSLNADTADRLVGRLADDYGLGDERRGPGWQPLDEEKDLAAYQPAVEVPDAEAVRAGLVVPEVAEEIPGAERLLGELAAAPLDPWSVQL